MHEIRIPKLNANDETCILTGWTVEDGQRVRAGEILAVIETAKVAMDLVAECDGVLLRGAPEKAELGVGDSVGYLFADDAAREGFLARRQDAEASTDAYRITRKARELMARHALTASDLAPLLGDRKVVKESDIESFLADRAPRTPPGEPPVAALVPLGRHQQAVAATVAASRREIPDAFLVFEILCDRALDRLERHNAEAQTPAGLTELLVWEVARLQPDHPRLFGGIGPDGRSFLPAKAIHIGVTLDLGEGLFVPVLHDADKKTLAEVADELDDYRYAAFRRELAPESLTGAVFCVAQLPVEGLLWSLPVIMPGQAAMLSLCSVVRRPDFDPDGQVVARRSIQLGLAYDHRIVNGSDAARFMSAIKQRLERPTES